MDRKRLFVAIAAMASNCFWLASLANGQFNSGCIAWFITLIAAGLLTSRFLLTKYPSPQPQWVRIEIYEGSRLPDTVACTYIGLSLLIVLLILPFQFNPANVIENRQFIDIELTSASDYQNRKELLPSTEPKKSVYFKNMSSDSQAHRLLRLATTGDPIASNSAICFKQNKGASRSLLSTIHRAQILTENSKPTFIITEPLEKEPIKATKLRVPWTNKVDPLKSQAESQVQMITKMPASAPIEMEEMAPADLIEVTDSANIVECSQLGGRSKNGKGVQSALSQYLHELHRRLKQAWSPPADTAAGKAEIVFRLRKDGALCWQRLNCSAGDPEVDQSALAAIAHCAPFAHLPSDYPHEYLDLRYTFNYKSNELSEVGSLSLSEHY